MHDSDADTTGGTVNEQTDEAVTDGGTAEPGDQYLDAEVNLLSPSTGFMRDHLKLVWASFVAWLIATWGPVTATFLAPDAMTSLTIIGFPGHYFLVGFLAPTSSLILAAIYAHRRDKLDERYGIDTGATSETQTTSDEAAATDGGVAE